MKLASIEKLHSISPHPKPEVERLECAKIKEWPVVIPKGQFKNGDLVVFIQIDSIVPPSEIFKFLEKQKYRVWNARFKGAASSGLVMSLDILPRDIREEGPNLYEGLDVTNILDIVKHERTESLNTESKGGFPTNLISISDEESLLNTPEALNEIEGKEIYITQKVDGSSTTFIINNGEFNACSRRLILKENQGFPWEMANKYDLKSKLLLYAHNLAIQAETFGKGMNDNRLGLVERQIKVFRVKNLDTNQLYNWDELCNLCKLLEIPTVDLVTRKIFSKEFDDIEYFRNLADRQEYPNNTNGEGIVIAPVQPFYSEILGKYWSGKIINQNYK